MDGIVVWGGKVEWEVLVLVAGESGKRIAEAIWNFGFDVGSVSRRAWEAAVGRQSEDVEVAKRLAPFCFTAWRGTQWLQQPLDSFS